MKKKITNVKTRITVSEVPFFLKKYKIKMGYTGLMYYRNLGLIPPPEKEKGSKERFYNIFDLRDRILAIKLIASIFGLNNESIASYAKQLPSDAFNKLPLALMRIYSDLQIEYSKLEPEARMGLGMGPFEMGVFEQTKTLFLSAIKRTVNEGRIGMMKGMTADDYYLRMVQPLILKRWRRGTQRYADGGKASLTGNKKNKTAT